MFPPPARGAGKKRKQPTASSSSGGINLLDSIMGGMTKTMDRLPARKPGQGSSAIAQEDFQEVASHYMMAARPAQGTDPPDKNICKNPECGGRDFNVDMRRGDKICNSCGAVQNARSLEDYSEEKRTFADDDKKQDKQRAERNGDGKASTRAGGQHAQAEKLAMKVGADGGDGISPQDEARIEKYKEAVQHLGQQLTLPQAIVSDARSICDKLVKNQKQHDEDCTKKNCRLKFKHRPHAVVACGLLRDALQKHGEDRLFEQFKDALKSVQGVSAADAKQVGRVCGMVRDLLKGRPFECDEVGDNPPTGANAAAAAGSSSDSGADDGTGQYTHPAAGAVPLLRDELGLPFFIQQRAVEIVEDWQKLGMPSNIPQTIAAVAILRAQDELLRPRRENGQQVRMLDLNDVYAASGIAVATLKKTSEHEALPWPTTILRNTVTSLKAEGALTPTVGDEAHRILFKWLGAIDGDVWRFCRETRPRLLAACALYQAARADAAKVGSAALSAEKLASAIGSDSSVEVSVANLEAAMARLPSGA